MKAIKQEDTEKLVLLDNISVISLDILRKRVVFNFMNAIHIFGRWTPDYHYFQYDSENSAIKAFDKIKNMPFFKINYFISKCDGNNDLINKSSITTISIKEAEQKIIFNLNYSVTSYKENKPVEISKFVFWNYVNEDDMDDDRLEINNTLNTIEI